MVAAGGTDVFGRAGWQCAGSRSPLRHRRHDLFAVPPSPERGRGAAGLHVRRRLFPRHADTRPGQVRLRSPRGRCLGYPLDRGRRLAIAVRGRQFCLGHFRFRFSQSGRSRRRAKGDLSRAGARRGNWAFWISANRGARLAKFTGSISVTCCPPSGLSFPACAVPMLICQPRCAAFHRQIKCWSACAPQVFDRLPGHPTPSALPGFIGPQSKNPGGASAELTWDKILQLLRNVGRLSCLPTQVCAIDVFRLSVSTRAHTWGTVRADFTVEPP